MKERKKEREKKKNQISFSTTTTRYYTSSLTVCTQAICISLKFSSSKITQFKAANGRFGFSEFQKRKKEKEKERKTWPTFALRTELTGVSLQQPESKLNFFCSQLPFNHRCHPPSEWGRGRGIHPAWIYQFLIGPFSHRQTSSVRAVNDQEQRGRDKKTALLEQS